MVTFWHDIPVDDSTALGRGAIRDMNRARAMGTGVRDPVGAPALMGTDHVGGQVFVCRSATGPRILWLCCNWSVGETLDYLRDPDSPEPAVWRADLADRLAMLA